MTSKTSMTLPEFAKKVKKLATFQLFNLKLLLNGESSRGFSKFKKSYKLRGEMGRGGFGIVYRALRIADETPVAVKFIDRRTVREWGKIGEEQVPMEICMLARCSKIKGVIRLLDWYSIPEGYLIVMERPYPCVDMFDFIKAQGKLDEQTARFLFRQVAQTIVECGERRVLHRDIKDENVVIDLVSGETKLIDFGAATILRNSQYTDFQGTRLYCPPEWFLHALYLGREAAVWSLGVLLYNALNGRLPFRNEKDICTAHLLGPLPFYATVSDEARDLIARCLSFDPFARCTLEELVNHPWMSGETPDWTMISTGVGKKSRDETSDDEAHVSDVDEDDVENGGDENLSAAGSSSLNRVRTDSTGPESGVGSSEGSGHGQKSKQHRGMHTSLTGSVMGQKSLGDNMPHVPSKTLSHSQHATMPNRPQRRPLKPSNSTVITTLRRAMSRSRNAAGH